MYLFCFQINVDQIDYFQIETIFLSFAGDSTVGKSAIVQSFLTEGSQFPKNYNMVSISDDRYGSSFSCISFTCIFVFSI